MRIFGLNSGRPFCLHSWLDSSSFQQSRTVTVKPDYHSAAVGYCESYLRGGASLIIIRLRVYSLPGMTSLLVLEAQLLYQIGSDTTRYRYLSLYSCLSNLIRPLQ